MGIIILAVLLGMVSAMPVHLVWRKRYRRKQAALSLNAMLPLAVDAADETESFPIDENQARFARDRARIIARARESQSWKEAQAYVRERFRGAERRQLAQDLVRVELACAAQIARDQKVLIRDPRFRKDLSTLLQYTAGSGRWEEARAYVRKTYAGARQPIVLRALAQAEATAKAMGPSQKADSESEESEACASALPEEEGT